MRIKWTLIAIIVVIGLFMMTTNIDELNVERIMVEQSDATEEVQDVEGIMSYWNDIEWDGGGLPEMERAQDFTVVLETKSDQTFDYKLWIGDDDRMTIVSPRDGEGIGKLDVETTMMLETELEQVVE